MNVLFNSSEELCKMGEGDCVVFVIVVFFSKESGHNVDEKGKVARNVIKALKYQVSRKESCRMSQS